MKFAVQISGLRGLFRRIKRIEDKKRQVAVLRKTLRAGAAVINKLARKLAKKTTGALRKAMGIKIKVYRKSGVVVAIIGPRTKFMFGRRKPSKYAHLVHGGRKAFVQARPNGTQRQMPVMPPNPFLADAVKQGAQQARAAMYAKCNEEMAKP